MSTGYRVILRNRNGIRLASVPVVPVNAATDAEGTAVNTDSNGLAVFSGLTAGDYSFRTRNVKTGDASIQLAEIIGATGSMATPTIVLGSAAAAGTATTTIRSDSTVAAFDTTVPTTSAVGDAAAVGTVAFAARRDHTHGREAFATNAIVLGTAAAAGVATTLMRRDDTIAAFDATVPTTITESAVAATGSVAFAARRDHTHGAPATWAATAHALGGATHTGQITTASLSDYTAPTTWSPTWVGLTVGNGTLTARYEKIGKRVFFSLKLAFGTTTSISGAVTFSLPVTGVAGGADVPFGSVLIWDNSAGDVLDPGMVYQASTTTAQPLDAAGEPFTATVPITWETSDFFTCDGHYEAA